MNLNEAESVQEIDAARTERGDLNATRADVRGNGRRRYTPVGKLRTQHAMNKNLRAPIFETVHRPRATHDTVTRRRSVGSACSGRVSGGYLQVSLERK